MSTMMSTRVTLALLLVSSLAILPRSSRAEEALPRAPAPPGPAVEVNVLWPFFPGGLTDLKVLVPVVRPGAQDLRGELVLGAHSDFGWRSARDDTSGKVAILAAKVGYRQFFAYGLHLDVTANLGWRQERDNPYDHTTLDGAVGRLWSFFGIQHALSDRFYVNARGGVGVHLFRTDRFADKERLLIPAGDVNFGVRF